jgi:hypothetical protein
MENDLSLHDIIDILESDDVATSTEIQLVADILDDMTEAINSIVLVRTGYDDFDTYYKYGRDVNDD